MKELYHKKEKSSKGKTLSDYCYSPYKKAEGNSLPLTANPLP
jgi:hypothetical protein